VKLLHDANAIVCEVQTAVEIPPSINEQMEQWRRDWKEKMHPDRPLSALSSSAKSARDVSERLQEELVVVSILVSMKYTTSTYRITYVSNLKNVTKIQ